MFLSLDGNFTIQDLLGMNKTASTAMREEAIELPQTVAELQLMCLQLREELIEARAAKEHLQAETGGEIGLLNEQASVVKNIQCGLNYQLLEMFS